MTSPNQPRIIDTKMPLTWLLSTAGTVTLCLVATLWNVAGQSNKLDQLIIAQAKIEKRLDEGSDRYDKLKDQMYDLKSTNSQLALKVTALESRATSLESLRK